MSKSKPKLIYSELTKPQRMKVRKEAYRNWALSRNTGNNTQQMFQATASNTGLDIDTVKKLHKKDKWEERYQQDLKSGKFEREIKKEQKKVLDGVHDKSTAKTIKEIIDESGLQERMKMFIVHYLQSFNATQSAKKAGYTQHSATVAAYQIMANPKVKEVLSKCTELMQTDLYISGKMILEEYMRIAFADMTDYVEFDNRRVRLKNSADVDGRLITEVKQGKDGVTIKLADKMKAIERLEKLFNVIPDRKLQLELEKFEFTKQLAQKQVDTGNKVIILNDL
jgi:phage terminase small subunit